MGIFGKRHIETIILRSINSSELEDRINNFLKIGKNLKGFKLISSNIAITSNGLYCYQLTYEYIIF